MCVDSWSAFYSIRKEREQRSLEKRGAALRKASAREPVVWLEVEPQAELHAAPIVCSGQVQEITGPKGCVDGVVLGMIEEVKVFRAEIEARLFSNRKPLEDAKVEIEAARQIQSVAPDISQRHHLRGSASSLVVIEWPSLRRV